MEESSHNSRHQQRDIQISNSSVKYHQNGDIHSHTSNNFNRESLQSNETLNTTTNVRLPSPSKTF